MRKLTLIVLLFTAPAFLACGDSSDSVTDVVPLALLGSGGSPTNETTTPGEAQAAEIVLTLRDGSGTLTAGAQVDFTSVIRNANRNQSATVGADGSLRATLSPGTWNAFITWNATVSFLRFDVLRAGTGFFVFIQEQPPAWTVTVGETTPVSTTERYTLNYQVTGLTGQLVLTEISAGRATITADGSGSFPTQLVGGAAYSIGIQSQPSNQTCSLQNSSGFANASMPAVQVTCVAKPATSFTVGGTVTGFVGTMVIRNGSHQVVVNATDGSAAAFAFSNTYGNGTNYSIQVFEYDHLRTCSISNGSGTVSGANITNITITCAKIAHPVGNASYTVSALTANGALGFVYGIGVSPLDNFLFVSHWPGRVTKVNPTTGTTENVFYDPYWETGNSELTALTDTIVGMTVDGQGRVHVADVEMGRVARVDGYAALTVLHTAAAGSYNDVEFGPDGSLYAASLYGTIEKIAPNGTVTTFYNGGGYLDAITVDPSGNVFAINLTTNSIRKITPDGNGTLFAGSGSCGFADGTGAAAAFCSPRGIHADSSGNVFVADNSNHAVRRIAPDGTTTTIAGTGDAGTTDGAGNTARLAGPWDLVVDSNGVITVVDGRASGYQIRLRRITP